MEGGLDLLMSQALAHQPHHAQVDPRLAGGGYVLMVLAHGPCSCVGGARSARWCAAPSSGEAAAGSRAGVGAALGPPTATTHVPLGVPRSAAARRRSPRPK